MTLSRARQLAELEEENPEESEFMKLEVALELACDELWLLNEMLSFITIKN